MHSTAEVSFRAACSCGRGGEPRRARRDLKQSQDIPQARFTLGLAPVLTRLVHLPRLGWSTFSLPRPTAPIAGCCTLHLPSPPPSQQRLARINVLNGAGDLDWTGSGPS